MENQESIPVVQKVFMLLDLLKMGEVNSLNPSGTWTTQRMLTTEEYNKVKQELFILLELK